MTIFYNLKVAPSGDVIEGVDDEDVLIWSAAEQKWFAGPGGGGDVTSDDVTNESDVVGVNVTDALDTLNEAVQAADEPFSLVYYVDVGKVDSTETGSDEQPFLTIQAAVDALALAEGGPGTVLITDGDYAGMDVTISHNVALVALGNLIIIGDVVINAGSLVNFENLTPDSITTSADIQMSHGGAGEVTAIGIAHIHAQHCAFGTFINEGYSGRITAVDCTMNEVNTGNFVATDCIINQDIIAGSATLRNCQWNGTTMTITSLNAKVSQFGGLVDSQATNVDTFSLTSIRLNGQANVLNGLNILDRLLVLNVSLDVPALTATFADIVVPATGSAAVKGDQVLINLTANPDIEDNIMISAWISDDEEVTVRVFGTTAGTSNQGAVLSIFPSKPTNA